MLLPPGLLELPATVAVYEVPLIAGHSIFAMAVAVEDALLVVAVAVATVGEAFCADEVVALGKVRFHADYQRVMDGLPMSCCDDRLRELQVVLGFVEVLLAHSETCRKTNHCREKEGQGADDSKCNASLHRQEGRSRPGACVLFRQHWCILARIWMMLDLVRHKACLVRLLLRIGERLVRVSDSDLCWRVLLLVAVACHLDLVSKHQPRRGLGGYMLNRPVRNFLQCGAARAQAEDDLYEILGQPRSLGLT